MKLDLFSQPPIAAAAPPRFLFVETTTECNLRCKQCHMWLTREPPGTLTTDEKIALVDELAGWSPGATVVLTGGETMQKKQEFYALSAACRRHGLRAAANTNATLLDEFDHERLLVEGPHYLVISLDSHEREVHDYIRGVPGTFDQVVDVIRRLVARKRASGEAEVSICTNLIVCDLNYATLGAYVAFVEGLGVDGIMFQPLARTFLLAAPRDGFFDRHFPSDVDAFDRAIDELLERQARGARLLTSAGDLAWMKLYVRDPDFIGEQVCGSHERNMMVDMRGDVQLCFSMRGLLGGRALGNVRTSSLRALWEGEMAARARGIMSTCRQNCGMLNCHRKLDG
jgi:MoaA/NifB/PqqE/SkfB family radical SAM enzyme